MNHSRYHGLFKQGNMKLPKTTLIFNMCAAYDCPSLKLGLCQAYNQHGRLICYAFRDEQFRPHTVLVYRRKQAAYWNDCTVNQFVNDVLNITKHTKIKALRVNESGDFSTQKDVNKLEQIAKKLKPYGIRVYCYTARKDLDYKRLKYLVVNGSNFTKQGVKGCFKMVLSVDDIPGGFKLCPMDCRKCVRCQLGLKTCVLAHGPKSIVNARA